MPIWATIFRACLDHCYDSQSINFGQRIIYEMELGLFFKNVGLG